MRAFLRTFRLILPLSLLVVQVVYAQGITRRAALLALHDSAQQATPAQLASLRSATTYVSNHDPELARLRQAFLILRQGELDSSGKLLRNAGEEFYNVTARHDDWPLAWYGIGLTERALARGKFPVLPARFHPLGADHNQGAIQAFVYALQKDSTFLPAAEGLAEAVQATTRWGYTGKARDALRRTSANSALTLLVQARLERRDHRRERAADLLQRALQLGGDSGVIYQELAREQFALGRDSLAARTYWKGVEQSRSPTAIRMLGEQLALIARPGELDGFDSLTAIGRASLVRRFWTIREVDAGVPSGERLREHFQRYELASDAYQPRHTGMTPVRMNRASRMAAAFGYGPSPTTEGGIYSSRQNYQSSYSFYVTRLGPPISQTVRSPFGLDDGYGISTAAQGDDRAFGDSYRQFNSRFIAGGMLDEIEPSGGQFDRRGEALLRYGPPDDMVGNLWIYHRPEGNLTIAVNGWRPGSYCAVSSTYCGIEMRGYLRPGEAYALRDELRASRDTLLATDRMIRPFDGALDAAVDAYAMIDAGTGEGRILVALAVPARQVEPLVIQDGFVYPVRIQLIASPPSGAYRVERDTTRYFRTDRRLGEGEYLQAVELLPVAPASYHLRVVIQTADGVRGTVGGDDSVDVSTVRSGVALSDIILGRDSSGLSWWSGTDRLKLNPSGQVSRNEQLYLYYQLGGLPLGRPYQTSLEVSRATSPKDKPLITLSYDEVADSSVMEIQRVLDLTRLDPGVHTIQLTIRDAKGMIVARRHASVRVRR
jgi:hypothetical protein